MTSSYHASMRAGGPTHDIKGSFESLFPNVFIPGHGLLGTMNAVSKVREIIYWSDEQIAFELYRHLRCLQVHYSKRNYHTTWASCQIRKIAGAHAPGMPGTFSPSPQVSDPDMHPGTCVTHVPWCMPGSLTIGFLWHRRRGKTFPAFPAHAQPAILRIW